ncbi:hypothetical protein CYMTET_15464 [Cymbomonas tetramitiformis]|uniref:Uncharacterized protein n=1 Tax=Cymbomonas tetramitiformis TaxID=36881 RepID=A0AAE0GE51_9CHLO|nr:hypothetical protein CYMTET_15464 [Cymbomonas tetramitiformis]
MNCVLKHNEKHSAFIVLEVPVPDNGGVSEFDGAPFSTFGLAWDRQSAAGMEPVYNHLVCVDTLGASRPGSGFGQRQWEAASTLLGMLVLYPLGNSEPVVARSTPENLGWWGAPLGLATTRVTSLCALVSEAAHSRTSVSDTKSAASDDCDGDTLVVTHAALDTVSEVLRVVQDQAVHSVGNGTVIKVERDLNSGGLLGLDLVECACIPGQPFNLVSVAGLEGAGFTVEVAPEKRCWNVHSVPFILTQTLPV